MIRYLKKIVYLELNLLPFFLGTQHTYYLFFPGIQLTYCLYFPGIQFTEKRLFRTQFTNSPIYRVRNSLRKLINSETSRTIHFDPITCNCRLRVTKYLSISCRCRCSGRLKLEEKSRLRTFWIARKNDTQRIHRSQSIITFFSVAYRFILIHEYL
jgi:hypothetical protein